MKKKLKLNLGSGKDYMIGWVNVDIMSEYNPDIIADLHNTLPFENESVSEVKAYDILEHFTIEDGELFIRECWRVLTDGGLLHMRLPNVKAISHKFKHDPEVMLHYIYGNTKETGVFGAHKSGYTQNSLKRLLHVTGFRSIIITSEDTNFRVSAQKRTNSSEPTKIGVIQQSPDMGGAETYMLNLIERWQSHGDDVFVATNKGLYAEALRQSGVQPYLYKTIVDVIGDWKGLVKTALTLPYSMYIYMRIALDMKKHGVTTVLMSEFSERIIVAPLLWWMRISVVWIEYARPVDTFQRNHPVSKILFRLTKSIPKAVITPTRYAKKSLMLDGRVSQAKIHVIPCGTRIPKKVLKQVNKNQQKFNIVCVSRLAREKGQDYLIDAMKSIRTKFNAQLLIVGDGPDKEYFKQLIHQQGLDKCVTLMGRVEDIDDLYRSADVCVFPTVWHLEGFGLVLIEAMAHGIPVVATSTGPVQEVVQNAGVMVPPRDSTALSDAICNLLGNAALRQENIIKGLQHVKENYDIQVVAQRIRKVLVEAAIED